MVLRYLTTTLWCLSAGFAWSAATSYVDPSHLQSGNHQNDTNATMPGIKLGPCREILFYSFLYFWWIFSNRRHVNNIQSMHTCYPHSRFRQELQHNNRLTDDNDGDHPHEKTRDAPFACECRWTPFRGTLNPLYSRNYCGFSALCILHLRGSHLDSRWDGQLPNKINIIYFIYIYFIK